MSDDFGRELVKRHPELNLEEDAPLLEWLLEKHEKTLQKQEAQATAEVAARDVVKYADNKDAFVWELYEQGLSMDDAADRLLALALWKEHGHSIVVEGQDVYRVVEDVESEVARYVRVKRAHPLRRARGRSLPVSKSVIWKPQ